jgi:hypothetical protein
MIDTFFKNLLGTAALTIAAFAFMVPVFLVLLPASVPFVILATLSWEIGYPIIGSLLSFVLVLNGWVTAVERKPEQFSWVFDKLKKAYNATIRFAIDKFWT